MTTLKSILEVLSLEFVLFNENLKNESSLKESRDCKEWRDNRNGISCEVMRVLINTTV